jgi:predicted permease
MTRLEQAALRIYRALARAFPEEAREAYGADLMETAEDVVRDTAHRGTRARRLCLLPRLLSDLVFRVVVEHTHDALRDLRYAVRMLARSKGFTLAATLCLAIGIGLTTAVFSQIRSTVLRELPGAGDTEGIVRMQRPVAYLYFEEIRDRSGLFSAVAAYMAPVPLVINQDGTRPRRVWAHLTTPDYFEALGAHAAIGRVFGADERTPGGGTVAVISDRLWRTQFGADPTLIGRALRINGLPVTVIGVASAGFLGASPTTAAADVWLPTTGPRGLAPELADLESARASTFEVVGRLRPDVAIAQAENTLEALVRRLEQAYADPARDSQERRVRLLPGGRMFAIRAEDVPRAIGFPLVLVSLVLLMGCGNVATMLLARGAARRREISVRLSLGAGRSRIVRQMLTESLVLIALGAAGGIVCAYALLAGLESMRPLMPDYGYFEPRIDWAAAGGATMLAAGFSVLFGLAPALRAGRQDIYVGLKPQAQGGSQTSRSRRWASLRNLLVFQQVAASMVLLLLTGFVVVGWQRSAGVEIGFDTTHLYRLALDPVRDGYSSARTQELFAALTERLRSAPGVTNVSLAQTLPMAMSNAEAVLSAKVEFVAGPASLGATRADRVGAGFFETVGIPLRRGRTFTDRDERDDARVVIVNETLAAHVWPGEDPVGRTVDLDDERWQVIGVVGDIRPSFPLAPTMPALYRPVTPAGFMTPSKQGVAVVVRAVPGFDAAAELRREIEVLDPNLTIVKIVRMSEDVEQGLYLASVATVVYGGMGVFGLILSTVGLAGVTAHAVAHRTHEIGIRMALGAQRAQVLWLVMRESSLIVAAGAVAGLAAALLVTWALASFVETLAATTRTSMSDPLLLLGAPVLLAGLALLACYLPARRSIRINPVIALRAD